MGKIYNANGGKMNLAEICEEIQQTITSEQKMVLAENLNKHESIENSQMRLAHAILDTYRSVDSTCEQGMRMRKLLDNVMTKYQKSSPANPNDQAIYRNLIREICK